MDGVWSGVVTSMGHTPSISPQTTLDNNAFFASTDILIVSSGVINLSPVRISTILAFLQTGKPVYIQTEYQSTYNSNQAFASIIGSLGGTFNWTGTVAGTLAPMIVLGTFATTINSVPSLSYFWYGDAGIGDCNTIPFLQFSNQYFGWQYVPSNAAWGNIISTCDQDWVNQSTSLPLMQNIITHLINPGFIPGPNGGVHLGNDTTLCVGNQLVLNATASGATYLWQNNSTNPTFTVTGPGTYFVTVTGACGVSHDTIIVSYSTLTTSILSQTNVSCNGGSNGNATVSAVGTGPFTYAWLPSGGNSATASNLSAGTYTVTVHDASSCPSTQTVTITQPTALLSTSTFVGATCGNNNGSASVVPSGGTGPYTYAWAPSGGNSANAINLGAGNYTCTITDAHSCIVTQSVIITNSSSLVLAVQSQNNVTCNGGTNGNATINPSGGTGPYTYAWAPSGGNAATASNLATGTYTVTVTDASLCSSTQTVSITQPTAISLAPTSTPASCGNNNGSAAVVANGGNGPYTYAWAPSGGNSANAINLVGGNYTVTVTDANLCVSTVSVTVASTSNMVASVPTQQDVSCNAGTNGTATATIVGGTGPYTYAWLPSGGNAATGTNLSAGIYTVTVTDAAGCSSVANVTITEPAAIVLTTSGNITICAGNSTTLLASSTGGTGSFTYTWNPAAIVGNSVVVSPVATTAYLVTTTDANGCTTSQPLTVTVSAPVTLLVLGSIQICAGQTTTLNANASTGGPYTWQPGNLSGSSVIVAPLTTTTYTVSVFDPCTNANIIDSLTVSVETITPQFLQVPSSGCGPLTVQFTDQSFTSIGSITTWLWNFGDGNFSTLQNPSHIFTITGSYNVILTVTSSNGCIITYTNPTPVNVYPLPTADFLITNLPVTALEPSAAFQDNSIAAVTWQWDFGDGGTSNVQNPSHVYAGDTGTYSVMLIVSNSYGCVDTAYGELIVHDEFTFFIPNAFTPNGNGLNETFSGMGSGISEFHMLVFDRWGMLLYESHDINKPWDGTFKGKNVSQDVYVYKIDVKDIFAITHYYIGHVSVVR